MFTHIFIQLNSNPRFSLVYIVQAVLVLSTAFFSQNANRWAKKILAFAAFFRLNTQEKGFAKENFEMREKKNWSFRYFCERKIPASASTNKQGDRNKLKIHLHEKSIFSVLASYPGHASRYMVYTSLHILLRILLPGSFLHRPCQAYHSPVYRVRVQTCDSSQTWPIHLAPCRFLCAKKERQNLFKKFTILAF